MSSEPEKFTLTFDLATCSAAALWCALEFDQGCTGWVEHPDALGVFKRVAARLLRAHRPVLLDIEIAVLNQVGGAQRISDRQTAIIVQCEAMAPRRKKRPGGTPAAGMAQQAA